MSTQKTFKRRVRARMTKTGESYTAARHQLLAKARMSRGEDEASRESDVTPAPEPGPLDPAVLPTSNDALTKATGRPYEAWFAELDAWGAVDRRHPEIAAWLVSALQVEHWWAQTITVAYERARGMRTQHQVDGGYQVSVNRTVGVGEEELLAAFTDPRTREHWLPGAPIAQRPTRASGTARFDWHDPASRVAVYVTARAAGKSTVSVVHEKLPDAASADRLKTYWRERLPLLKQFLEGR